MTDIYFKDEDWHFQKMPYGSALRYHQRGLDDGSITVYVADGEVLGYYERRFVDNTCFLYNLYVKPQKRMGKVIKSLKRVFFGAMPVNIDKVIGRRGDKMSFHKRSGINV